MNLWERLFRLAWRNLWRVPRRTFIILAAIAVGTWSMVVFDAVLRAWAESLLDDTIITLLGHGQIHARGYLDDPSVIHSMPSADGAFRALLDSAEVVGWAERVRVPAMLMTERDSVPVQLVGIDPKRERGLSFIATAVRGGVYLKSADDDGLLLGGALANTLRTGLGKRVVLLSQDRAGNIASRGFRVVGIFKATRRETENEFVFVGRTSVQVMLGLERDITEISFILRHIGELPGFSGRLAQAAPHLDVQSWSNLEPFAHAMYNLTDGFVSLWVVIIFIAIAFGILNTMLIVIFERTREFGLLQALGMRPRLIVGQVLLESTQLIGLSVLTGLILGGGTVSWFHDGLDLSQLGSGMEWLGGGKVLYPRMHPAQLAAIGSFIWGMGILISLYPAWRAARDVPVNVLSKT